MASEKSVKMRLVAYLGCIGSALLMVNAITATGLGQKLDTSAPPLAQPSPRDFAQAVQAPKGIAFGYPQEWYRLALPVSSACFFVSFAIWSLHSVGNHALRPLAFEDEVAS